MDEDDLDGLVLSLADNDHVGPTNAMEGSFEIPKAEIKHQPNPPSPPIKVS